MMLHLQKVMRLGASNFDEMRDSQHYISFFFNQALQARNDRSGLVYSVFSLKLLARTKVNKYMYIHVVCFLIGCEKCQELHSQLV